MGVRRASVDSQYRDTYEDEPSDLLAAQKALRGVPARIKAAYEAGLAQGREAAAREHAARNRGV